MTGPDHLPDGMTMSRRCSSCGNPLAPELSLAHDGACPWCLAAFTFGPETSAVATEDSTTRIGKYVRTEKLGAGGMGEVWKALDTELNRWVALKFLKDEDPGVVARFQREARTAARLSHPGIAAVHEVGEAEGRRFIAMQYIKGRTMAEFPRNDRRLIVQLFRDAARALDHAHRQGVIHRDLKPENLMVEEREDGVTMVVLDFGLARPIEGGEKLSKSGEVYGTVPFMSPEQARGERLDVRADVYSLGATLYEVLTGKLPFEAPNLIQVMRKIERDEPPRPRKLNPGIPRDLETIILKCLAKSRNRRYASARELADDLDRYLNHDPVRARPPSTLYRVGMTLGKRKAAVAALVAGVVLAAAVGWWALSGSPTARHLQLSADAMKLWAEARGLAMAGVDPEGIRNRAKVAREAFDRALEVKEDAPLLVMRARCLQLEGKDDEAMKALERAHELDVNNAEARVELAKGLLVKYQVARGTPTITIGHSDSGSETRLYFGPISLETVEVRQWRERAERILGSPRSGASQEGLLMGLLAMGKGEHAQAARGFEDYTKSEPWDAQAVFLEGVCRYYLRDMDGAISALDRALDRVPGASRFTWRGHARVAKGLLEAADSDFTRAIDLSPKDALNYLHRGLARNAMGLHDEAIADYTAALALDPKAWWAHSNRGVAKSDKGLLDDAIADYTKAIDLNATCVLAYVNRGNAKRGKGLFDEAIKDYEKAIELEPQLADAYVNLGGAKTSLGLHDEAITVLTKAITLDSRNAEAYANRGLEYAGSGLWDRADLDFTMAIRLNPKFTAAYTNRGLARHVQGLYDQAIADHTKAIELDPRLAAAYVNRGSAKHAKGLDDEAIADHTKAIELDPKLPEAYSSRGIAKQAKGLEDEAIADYEKALALAPPDWPHRASVQERIKTRDATRLFNEAGTLLEQKKYIEAIEKYRTVVEKWPKIEIAIDSAYNIACGYALLGEKKNALDWLEKAIEIGWKDGDHLEKDSDLESLRGEERYKKLVGRLKGE